VTAIELPYTKRTLANGLDVVVHEARHVPIVAVNLWYHVGSKTSIRDGLASRISSST
jgi:predicted Zn-dependent peptidase